HLAWAHPVPLPAELEGLQYGEYWWLPDGKILYLQQGIGQDSHFFVYRSDTGHRTPWPFARRITEERFDDTDVSSDGHYVLLVSFNDTFLCSLTTGQHLLVNESGGHREVRWLWGGVNWLELDSGVTGNLQSPPLVLLGDRKTRNVRRLYAVSSR